MKTSRWVLFATVTLWLLYTQVAECQGLRVQDVAFNTKTVSGQTVIVPASGATITVCTAAATGTPCSPLAVIYSDQALTTAISGSHVTADSKGNFGFYIAAGTYIYTITGTGITSATFNLTVPFGISKAAGGGVNTGPLLASFDAFTQSFFAGSLSNQVKTIDGARGQGFFAATQDDTTNDFAFSNYGYFRDVHTTGTRNNGFGTAGEVYFGGATPAVITNAAGLEGYCENDNTGTVTNCIGVYAMSNVNNGGGTMTNSIGLLVADQSAGTNNYSIKTGLGDVRVGGGTLTFAPVGGAPDPLISTINKNITVQPGIATSGGGKTLILNGGQSFQTGTTSGGDIDITSGGANGAGISGGINIETNLSTATGSSGSIVLSTADGNISGTAPGHVNITTGNATVGNTNGGDIAITLGAGFGTGRQGEMTINGPISIGGTAAANFINKVLYATSAPGATAVTANTCAAEISVAVTGAKTSGVVFISPSYAIESGIFIGEARVSAADTVKYKLCNVTVGNITTGAGTAFNLYVIQ